MGKMKNMAMEISCNLGLGGEITPEVIEITDMVLKHHQQAGYERQALMALGIERLKDAILAENTKPETLKVIFQNEEYRYPPATVLNLMGKYACQCCVCKKIYDSKDGYTGGYGITHGYCEKHYKEAMEELKNGSN